MSTPAAPPTLADVMTLDLALETERIAAALRELTSKTLRKRGLVVAVSGGIDSSVCAALAVRAVGAERVFALLLPERESSPDSTARGRLLCEHLGVAHEVVDIAPTLEAIGCYAARDAALREAVPGYGPGWKQKIVIGGGLAGQYNHFKVVARSPDGTEVTRRLDSAAYLQIVAATNFKQRVRKTLEYFHADRLNYAVIGTPNRLEHDLGFFVRNGDGSADLKPIAHLYKTQVYALAHHLGLPERICSAVPTTDTYSLEQGQDEFYFALPYARMDVALWAFHHAVPAADLAAHLGLEPRQAEWVYDDIRAKQRATVVLASPPLLVP
jgi:NAD+ synthase